MARSILITGGMGFIGRHLTEYFSKNYIVSAPSHEELELTDEFAVTSFFKKQKFDFVIHCATKPGHRFAKDTAGVLNADSRMFFNLINNSNDFGKMIHIGSGSAYSSDHYMPKMKEESFGRHIPQDEASFSKYIASKFIEKVDNVIDLRIFGIFGKYEEYAIRFISNAICKTIFNLPITIKQNRCVDYIYIDDLVPIIEYFMDHQVRYHAYNVTPDASVELHAVAKKIRDISQKDVPILIAKDGMGIEYSGDNTRLKKEILNFQFTTIDEAIKKLYSWYEENRKTLNKELLLVDY